MKKILTIIAVAATTISLVSCDGTQGTKVETTGEKLDASASSKGRKDLMFKLDETIKLGDYVVTVKKIVDNAPSPDEFTTPESGKKFVAIEVMYENPTTDKQINYNPFDWKLIDSDAYNYDADMNTAKTPELNSGTLNPGQKARGWITFQTAKDAANFKAQFAPSWIDNSNVEIQLN